MSRLSVVDIYAVLSTRLSSIITLDQAWRLHKQLLDALGSSTDRKSASYQRIGDLSYGKVYIPSNHYLKLQLKIRKCEDLIEELSQIENHAQQESEEAKRIAEEQSKRAFSRLTYESARAILNRELTSIKSLEEANDYRRDIAFLHAHSGEINQSINQPWLRPGDKINGKILLKKRQREQLHAKLAACNELCSKLETAHDAILDEKNIDKSLLLALSEKISRIKSVSGYLYIRRWRLHDGTTWYKIGITSNPERRDIEQNVLPVPSETLVCVNAGSMEKARLIEAAILQILATERIRDAMNRELFRLDESQANALVQAMLEVESH